MPNCLPSLNRARRPPPEFQTEAKGTTDSIPPRISYLGGPQYFRCADRFLRWLLDFPRVAKERHVGATVSDIQKQETSAFFFASPTSQVNFAFTSASGTV